MPIVRRFVIPAILVIASTATGVLLAEAALRAMFPSSPMGTGYELEWFRKRTADKPQIMTPDEQLGFRPVLDGRAYSQQGILVPSSIISDHPAPKRLLFIGDSVTSRGRVIKAMARQLRSSRIDYLNGGVESYNVIQEADFFFRYQSGLKVDHIIHLLHTNDLQYTPIAFFDDDGELNVFAMNTDRRFVNAWLFQHSYLYRLVISAIVPRTGIQALADKTKASLRALRAHAEKRGIPYHVALFPIVSPPGQWTEFDKRSRDVLLKICLELGIPVIDLLADLNSLYAAGVDPREGPGDYWHPNDSLAEAAAKSILHGAPDLAAANDLQP